MNSRKTGTRKKSLGRDCWRPVCARAALVCLVAGLLLVWPFAAFSQSQPQPQASPQPEPQTSPGAQGATEEEPPRAEQRDGTISGTVVDATGAVVAGALVRLSRGNPSPSPEVTTDSDGQFFFRGIAPGSFQLTITSPGFTTETSYGTLHAGEDYTVPPVVLVVAASSSQVRVSMTPVEIAEAEIKDEERQRVLGVIPNFYVTYNHDAAPLQPKQKFELAWKLTVDPVNFGLTAAIAGIQQAANSFSGYGQGAQGYGKRLGAAYADSVTSTFIGGAILPSLFKQDPRYFYRGTGSRRGRFLYALANSVICKGDNGHWQVNYSAVLGSLAAGGISNLYYPESDRDATVTFENTLIAIGATAASNVLQEFVIRKLTRNAPTYSQVKSQP